MERLIARQGDSSPDATRSPRRTASTSTPSPRPYSASGGRRRRLSRRLPKLEPERAQVYVDLGRAQEKNNETDKAMRSYTDGDQARARLRDGLHAPRRGLRAAKELALRVRLLRRAEKLYEGQKNVEGLTEAHFQRGRLYVELGRRADARRELEKSFGLATESNNRFQQVQSLSQLSAVLVAENKVEEAIEHASRALEIAQANNMYILAVRGMIMLASAYMQDSNYVEAERRLDQAIDSAQKLQVRRARSDGARQQGQHALRQTQPLGGGAADVLAGARILREGRLPQGGRHRRHAHRPHQAEAGRLRGRV